MAKQQLKVAKLLVSSFPLILEVEDVPQKLELKLAWTMRAVILIEQKLREIGQECNALQDPSKFWTELDCAKLAIGVWATSLQEQPELATDDGFDTISSYLVPANYGVAAKALKEAFLESLSKERREEIRKAEAELAALLKAGQEQAKKTDPTEAPVQS